MNTVIITNRNITSQIFLDLTHCVCPSLISLSSFALSLSLFFLNLGCVLGLLVLLEDNPLLRSVVHSTLEQVIIKDVWAWSCHAGLIGRVLQNWLSFWKVLLSTTAIASSNLFIARQLMAFCSSLNVSPTSSFSMIVSWGIAVSAVFTTSHVLAINTIYILFDNSQD